ncbi:hypothetical protein V6N13_041608 [Hibiscus sabdariffa]|uniref:RNase H type-1 domain-containing protein n=1 Tax=Hibiscus sabdariffa TaxID=183260 RepID=A0ABR2RCD1_9ROSI
MQGYWNGTSTLPVRAKTLSFLDPRRPRVVHLLKSSAGVIKINVDGAFKSETTEAAVGVIARDQTGMLVVGHACSLTNVCIDIRYLRKWSLFDGKKDDVRKKKIFSGSILKVALTAHLCVLYQELVYVCMDIRYLRKLYMFTRPNVFVTYSNTEKVQSLKNVSGNRKKF